MATNNSWNNQIAAAKSAITLNSGTNAVNISTDASATTVNIGTGAAAKNVTVGSTTSTSPLTLNSGSGGVTLTGVAGVGVSNKNYVTINTSSGLLGSDAGPTSGSLVLIQTQTTAGATSIDFTSGISTTYSTYLIALRNMLAASGTPNLQMLFSTNGGSSYLSSNYIGGYNSTPYNSNTWTNASSTTVGLIGSLHTSNAYTAFLYINSLANGTYFPTYNGQAFQNSNQQEIVFGCNQTVSVNAIRFNTSSGNIIGTISLYGIAN